MTHTIFGIMLALAAACLLQTGCYPIAGGPGDCGKPETTNILSGNYKYLGYNSNQFFGGTPGNPSTLHWADLHAEATNKSIVVDRKAKQVIVKYKKNGKDIEERWLIESSTYASEDYQARYLEGEPRLTMEQ